MDEKIFDLCIVGAGVFGSAAARHASTNPSLKVCLIGLAEPTEDEVKDREIFSSHYDSGRIVKLMFELPSCQVLAEKSIDELPTIEKLSGLQFYNPVGALYIGKRSSRCMKQIEDTSATMGTKLTRLVDKDYHTNLYPFLHLKGDEYGLLNTTGSGIVDPRILIDAEKLIARQQGCQILVDEVNQIHKLKDGYHKIETPQHGVIKAKRVLITTGAFTNFNDYDVMPKMEIAVYKEKAALIKISESEAKTWSSMPGIINRRNEDEVGFYVLPPVKYPDGYYLKTGSMWPEETVQTLQKVKEFLMSEISPEETRNIAEPLFKLMPDLRSEELSCKICVTAETPTGFPYIDRVSPTVTVAVAGCGWGVTFGEEIGRLAAHLSLTGTWDSTIPKTLFEIVLEEH